MWIASSIRKFLRSSFAGCSTTTLRVSAPMSCVVAAITSCSRARIRPAPAPFLTLDFAADCELDGLAFHAGRDVLATRRRHHQFWTPAPHMEFGWYLARSVAKRRLDEERARKLSRLYGADPGGCETQVT